MNERLPQRRIAAHHVVVDGRDEGRCVVVCLPDGIVTDIHKLVHEEPFTEWLGGIIHIRDGRVV